MVPPAISCVSERSVPAECYVFDLSAGRIDTTDREQNQFRVGGAAPAGSNANAGSSSSVQLALSRQRGLVGADRTELLPAHYFPPPASPIQPRLFVVRADGTGTCV